jgi:hypothetical protein
MRATSESLPTRRYRITCGKSCAWFWNATSELEAAVEEKAGGRGVGWQEIGLPGL